MPPSRQPVWIRNALIATQDARRRVLRGQLRIEGGIITDLTGPRTVRERGARILDARGWTLLPGFVQAHVHLCQTLFRNQADDLELLDWLARRIWVMEAAHTRETLRTSARLGIHELLSTGTTCLLDMGTVRHTEAILEAVKETGIRASVGKCLMDHPGTTPPGLRDRTDDALREATDLHRRWNDTADGRIRVSYAPRFVISCTEALLREVTRISREQGAVVHTHASENRKELELVRKLVGRENVEYLHHLGMTSERLVLAHCVWVNEREKRILADTGTNVAHCPSSNLKLASGIAPVPDLRARGINVALGADGAPCNNNLNQFTEMRLAALLHKPGAGPRALRAQEALDMATLAGARALGWSDQIGSLAVGKRADLIAVDQNQPDNAIAGVRRGVPTTDALASSLVYSTQAHHLRWTWVNGRLLYRNGLVTGIPSAALMAEVRRAQAQIGRRITPTSRQ
jgi:cytosine/adenosine deaminase-related metal-dependent hydrolase